MIHFYKKLTQIYHQIRRPLIHSAIYVSGTLLSGLVSLITFPILARLISVEDMGKYDFFIFMLLSATPFVSFGIETGMGAIINEVNENKLRLLTKQAIYLSILSSLLLSFILFLLIKLRIFRTFSLRILLLWNICLIALSICRITRASLIWKKHAIKASILLYGGWIWGAVFGVTLLLITKRHTTELYLVGVSLGFILTAILSFLIFPPPKTNSKQPYTHRLLYKLLNFSYPYAITYSLLILSSGIEKAVILKSEGPYWLGIYALTTKIASIPKFIGTAFLLAIVPEIVSTNNSPVKTVRTLLLITTICSILFLVTFSQFSHLLVLLFGGEKYFYAEQYVPFAILSESLSLFPWILNSLLLKNQKTKLILNYGIITCLCTTTLAFYLVPHIGIYGALCSAITGKLTGIFILSKNSLKIVS